MRQNLSILTLGIRIAHVLFLSFCSLLIGQSGAPINFNWKEDNRHAGPSTWCTASSKGGGGAWPQLPLDGAANAARTRTSSRLWRTDTAFHRSTPCSGRSCGTVRQHISNLARTASAASGRVG